jgi:hypothetical protein
MAARGGKATAGNGGCWKNHRDDIAEAQTNSHRRPRPVGYPQDLTRQGWAAPKGKTRRRVAGLVEPGAEGEEMSPNRLRELNERIAQLFRDGSPISTSAEAPPITSVGQPNIDEAVSEASVIETAGTAENATAMADQKPASRAFFAAAP